MLRRSQNDGGAEDAARCGRTLREPDNVWPDGVALRGGVRVDKGRGATTAA